MEKTFKIIFSLGNYIVKRSYKMCRNIRTGIYVLNVEYVFINVHYYCCWGTK